MHLATQTDVIPCMLVPYFERELIPVLGASVPPPSGGAQWQCLESALQTFVVVTFNLGVFRERFRHSGLFSRVLVICSTAGLLKRVSWLELLVKLPFGQRGDDAEESCLEGRQQSVSIEMRR